MRPLDRREMLKLSSAALGTLAAPSIETPATAQTGAATVPQWEVFELTLPGPSSGNPFLDVQLTATFSMGHRSVNVDGFYDGSGQYKVRFMPDTLGEWLYTTTSSAPELSAKSGRFTCVAALPGAHGPVQVHNTYHFAYADGTPFFPFGTTCYAWVHQTEELQQQTLDSLSKAPFNKIRMC